MLLRREPWVALSKKTWELGLSNDKQDNVLPLHNNKIGEKIKSRVAFLQ
jgi:hypothetical protein